VVCTSTHTGNNLIDTGNLSRHTCLPIYWNWHNIGTYVLRKRKALVIKIH
jgi:hypothetical protein